MGFFEMINLIGSFIGIGFLYLVLFFTIAFISFYFYIFLFFRIFRRSVSVWLLVLKADNFHRDRQVVKLKYRTRKFWRIKLLFTIIRELGHKLVNMEKQDSIYSDTWYWSPEKSYVKGKDPK